MKITKRQLRRIIKEVVSEARKSDNYYAVRMELISGMGIPEKDVTDELIMAILSDPRYIDGEPIDAGAEGYGGRPGGFTRQDVYDLKRIIKEERAKLMENPQQMTFNQKGVDSVRAMADQIEPMFETLRKTAGQSKVAFDPLYEQLEDILMELPYQLEEIAKKMEKSDPVQGAPR